MILWFWSFWISMIFARRLKRSIHRLQPIKRKTHKILKLLKYYVCTSSTFWAYFKHILIWFGIRFIHFLCMFHTYFKWNAESKLNYFSRKVKHSFGEHTLEIKAWSTTQKSVNLWQKTSKLHRLNRFFFLAFTKYFCSHLCIERLRVKQLLECWIKHHD